MPKITVTIGSNRPGGIDVTLAGLVAQTFEDFEVVFVDGRYHQRHARVLDAVARSGLGQPFYHVPNYRYGAGVWGATCAGYNTGFALAGGDLIVMLLDHAYAPPDWLAHHFAHAGKVVMAPHEYRTPVGVVTKAGDARDVPLRDYHDSSWVIGRPVDEVLAEIQAQQDRFDEISLFDVPFTADRLDVFPREASDAKCDLPTGPLHYDYFNTKNESFPTEAVLAVNGMDENYDRGRGPGDPDLGLRLSRFMNAPTWNVREAIVHCLNPRRFMPNVNIVIPEDRRLDAPYDDRWYIQDGYRYFDAVKADPSRIRAPNRRDLNELRAELWPWRELSQERDPVLPRNIVADVDHFGV